MKRYDARTRPKPKPRPAEHGGKAAPPPNAKVAKAPSSKPVYTTTKPARAQPASGPPTHWDQVADWYDQLVGDDGSEYHREVVLPGVLRLLRPREGERVLDVGCGQGVLCRLLHERGARVTGVDASGKLIEAAKSRSEPSIGYFIGDARRLSEVRGLEPSTFDAATSVLAIQNIDPLEPVFQGVADLLKPGGRFIAVLMHPAFRGPKATSWGFDGHDVQYRRVDRYLLPRKEPIISHPGRKDGTYTWTFHRPLQSYVRALAAARLLIDGVEEWPSHKVSAPGPRAQAENTARQEIPMFMAIRAVKT